jgi:ankyrin repeat protein
MCCVKKHIFFFSSPCFSSIMASASSADAEQQRKLKKLLDAIIRNQMDRVTELLEQDRSLLLQESEEGCRPLHLAASWSHLDMMQLFVDTYGIPIDQKDNRFQNTALHVAERDAVEWLIQRGVDSSARNQSG